jgi:hypothetical protein
VTRGRGKGRTERGARRRGRTSRALRLIVIAVVALVAIVYLAVPIGFAAYASLPHQRAVGPPPGWAGGAPLRDGCPAPAGVGSFRAGGGA